MCIRDRCCRVSVCEAVGADVNLNTQAARAVMRQCYAAVDKQERRRWALAWQSEPMGRPVRKHSFVREC
eukprot:1464753-Alexandrium_andersonii.AAC.1